MRIVTHLACLVCLSGLVMPTFASPANPTLVSSPAGTWQWVHNKTGSTSVVQIDITDGLLKGTVLKVLHPSPGFLARNGNPPVCTACRGERHGQPIVGMVIVWGLHKAGTRWTGGHALDPSDGKIYKIWLRLADGGRTLKVRVYIGIPLFGRTLVWHRVMTQRKNAS